MPRPKRSVKANKKTLQQCQNDLHFYAQEAIGLLLGIAEVYDEELQPGTKRNIQQLVDNLTKVVRELNRYRY